MGTENRFLYKGTSTFSSGGGRVSEKLQGLGANVYQSSVDAKAAAAANQAALTASSAAAGVGSSASVQKGIFYIRGAFVQALTQTIILDKYSNSPSYRFGFSVTESLVTREENTGLLDNSTGMSILTLASILTVTSIYFLGRLLGD